MEDYEVPSVVHCLSSQTSGFSKRQSKRSLPRVFLAYCDVSKKVFGAFLLLQCFRVGEDASSIHWKCVRFVELVESVAVEAESIAWLSTIVHFTPAFEQFVRTQAAASGGILNHHFVEVAGSRWYAWRVSAELRQSIVNATLRPVLFESPFALARAVGITPTIVRSSVSDGWTPVGIHFKCRVVGPCALDV
jgi:hypothetical protein